MGFMDDVADVITDVSIDVRDKVVEVRDAAKLQLDYKDAERELKGKYEALGRRYYSEHKDDTDNYEINGIRETLDKLDDLKEQMEELRGYKICPVCKARNDVEATYCGKCGSMMGEGYTEPENDDVQQENVEKVDAEVVEEDKEDKDKKED